MKITNHQKGNFQYCRDSVMYGTIQIMPPEHYKKIAEIIQNYSENDTTETASCIAYSLASYYGRVDSNFNRDEFADTAGIPRIYQR